jgi:DNA-binding response OmpR family regulator
MKKTHPKILIVDDEPNIVLALEFLLKKQGYKVKKAFDGLQALEILADFTPNIIVLDVMMPNLDGFETAAAIRKIPALGATKIVFLTAKGTETDRKQGYNTGAEYYMIKPFDNDVFLSTIAEILMYG